MNIQQIIDILIEISDKHLIITIIISSVFGITMNYYGLRFYTIVVFIFGAIIGTILGGVFSGNISSLGIQIIFIVISTLFFGWLTVLLSNLTGIILGIILGGFIGFLSAEPIIFLTLAIIGGFLGYIFQNMIIIISTVATGSTVLLYSFINFTSFFSENISPLKNSKFSSYLSKLAHDAYNNSSYDLVLGIITYDLITLLFFIISGFYIQTHFFLKFKR